jgi:hypothetical protein
VTASLAAAGAALLDTKTTMAAADQQPGSDSGYWYGRVSASNRLDT